LVRGVIKPARNRLRQYRIKLFQLEEHIGQNRLDGEGFGPKSRQIVLHRPHAAGARNRAKPLSDIEPYAGGRAPRFLSAPVWPIACGFLAAAFLQKGRHR
jgi:hypothetical protein